MSLPTIVNEKLAEPDKEGRMNFKQQLRKELHSLVRDGYTDLEIAQMTDLTCAQVRRLMTIWNIVRLDPNAEAELEQIISSAKDKLKQRQLFPSHQTERLVEFLYSEGNMAFIIGLSGPFMCAKETVPTMALDAEMLAGELFTKGDGAYLFRVKEYTIHGAHEFDYELVAWISTEGGQREDM
jgi:hypothetical protein